MEQQLVLAAADQVATMEQVMRTLHLSRFVGVPWPRISFATPSKRAHNEALKEAFAELNWVPFHCLSCAFPLLSLNLCSHS